MWLQEIIERWVIKVCTGFMWLMIKHASGLCIHGKETSILQQGEPHSHISEYRMDQDFSHNQISAY